MFDPIADWGRERRERSERDDRDRFGRDRGPKEVRGHQKAYDKKGWFEISTHLVHSIFGLKTECPS